MGLITIPGNIKQQYLPFVLKPGNKLNLNVGNSKELAGANGAQCFSFRRKMYESAYKAGFALLNVCPSSFREAEFGNFMEQDVSFRTLFAEINKYSGRSDKRSITADDLFDAIPGIQIREYLPDTRLDQVFNLFGDLVTDAVKNAIWPGTKAAAVGAIDMLKWVVKGGVGKFLADPNKLDELKLSLGYIFDWVLCNDTPNNRNLLVKDGKPRFSLPGNSGGAYYQFGDADDTKVLTLPYTLYYRLQSCVTTNVYELPYRTDTAFDVRGQEGWGGSSIGLENKWLEKIPIIGSTIFQTMFSNVRINFMNWWDSKSGSATPQPEVTVKFSLFNDTAERAMMNFIFVNTVAPNNMWVQYGLFQHSSSVYDIKVEGHSRLFACAGNVKIDYKGVLRNPPPGWIDRLVYTYGNGDFSKQHGCVNVYAFASSIKEQNLIKIPDVYEVTMTFKSMLPQNLNTYLYQYSENANIEDAYTSGSVYQESMLPQFTLAKEAAGDLDDYNKNYRSGDLQKKRQSEKDAAQ